MIEIGDLVKWNNLTIHPNDLATIYERIKDGRRLDDLIITNLTTLEEHIGLVQTIEEGWIVIIDFVGRDTISVSLEEAYEKLTIINRK